MFQGKIQYISDGLYPAPAFFSIGIDSGIISLKSSVMSDALFTNPYLLRLLAYDNAYPSTFGTATVTININRNPNSPRFLNTQCRGSIPEETTVGTIVFNATAVDDDGVSF